MDYSNSSELEKHLSYSFSNISLLEEALNHRTFVHEQRDSDLMDNQRLEFLGDAVLGLVIGHILMNRYPNLKEGELTRMRANLVNEAQLAQMARHLEIGIYVRLGKGEIQTRGMEKQSILADTFEALVAAIYLDGGYRAAFKCIKRLFMPLLHGDDRDCKSRLQEWIQKDKQPIPEYSVIAETGPDHDKTYQVVVSVAGISTEGTGKSKKLAEQVAAGKALAILHKEKHNA